MMSAVQPVKKMRGRSRAMHMVAANGWHYVVKPPSIGLRAMINEWLGAKLCQMIGIMASDVQPIKIPDALAKECWPELRCPDLVGVASAFPTDPSSHAIYDFLPDTMANKIANPDHAIGALAVDLWTGMTERRHCIYFRQGPWWACVVDHKGMFGGDSWNCSGMLAPTNPAARWVYETFLTEEQIDLWSAQICAINPESLHRLCRNVPECWTDVVTRFELSRLAEHLLSRRGLVPAMLRNVAGTPRPMIGLTCDTMAQNASCLSS